MKLMALAAVSLILVTVIGCGSSQEPGTEPSVPSVVLSDAGSDGPGATTPGDSGEADSALYADSSHDAGNPADPVTSCFDCPPGQVQECAILCTKIHGYIAGDGNPYQCCWW